MNRQNDGSVRRPLLIGAALLVVVAAVVGIFFVLNLHKGETLPINLATKPRLEMQPQDSKEWLEKHYPGLTGKDVKVVVYYRDNNEVGVREFAPNGNLTEESIFYGDGSKRSHAVYAADGAQVVEGFELREDRTVLWMASNDGKLVHTTTMWYDGKQAFSIENRGIGSSNVDVQYFYKTGKPWLHYVGKRFNDQNQLMSSASEAQLFSNDGTKVMEITADEAKSAVSVYRADGSLSYVQEWETFPWYRFPDGTIMRRLTKVSQYSPDGKRLVRTLEVQSGTSTITKATDYAEDGSRTEYHMRYWGGLDSVEKFDKDGKSLGTVDPKTVTFKIDDGAIAGTYLPDPTVEWKKQEKDPSSRNEDGSPIGTAPVDNPPVSTPDPGID